MPSNLLRTALQRRLGLYLPGLASISGLRPTDYLGDSILADGLQEHSSRHHKVNNVWYQAATAVFGAAAMRKPTSEPAYSVGANPDWVAEFAGEGGVHTGILGENKVYNPLRSDETELRRASVYPFGATEYDLRISILGEHAGTAAAPLLPRADGKPHPTAKYESAIQGGHRVVPIIHEIFGGLAHEAVAFLAELGRLRSQALGADGEHATWAARSFMPFWRQRISIAVQLGTALELARAVAQGEDHVRAIARGRAKRAYSPPPSAGF